MLHLLLLRFSALLELKTDFADRAETDLNLI